MIITDGIHIMTNGSIDELHHFAKSINFKRAWFQDHPRHPHYDITTPNAHRRVIAAGAMLVTKHEMGMFVLYKKLPRR